MTAVDVAVCAILILAPTKAFAGHTLGQLEQRVLSAWLSVNSGFRVATSADCDCQEDIAQMRRGYGGVWKGNADYQPYVATGDFNGDSHRDFAVVVIDTSKPAERGFSLLVFNGPFDGHGKTPAFTQSDMDLRYTGLFFGPPRPRPYRLVVGNFESEGRLLVPHGKSYIWDE